MSKVRQSMVEVRGAAVTILSQQQPEFVHLTNIARFRSVDRFDDLIRNRPRNRRAEEFPVVRERCNGPGFYFGGFAGVGGCE